MNRLCVTLTVILQGAGGGGDGRRQGDWDCSKCGRTNYARNQVCYVKECKWPARKPYVVTRQAWYGQEGDEDKLFSSRNQEEGKP